MPGPTCCAMMRATSRPTLTASLLVALASDQALACLFMCPPKQAQTELWCMFRRHEGNCGLYSFKRSCPPILSGEGHGHRQFECLRHFFGSPQGCCWVPGLKFGMYSDAGSRTCMGFPGTPVRSMPHQQHVMTRCTLW